MTPEELRKAVFYLDGLRYSFAMAEVSVRRLTSTLDSLAQGLEASRQAEDDVTSALLDAWVLVDMCYRVRELIQQTPGLSQKSPPVQIFLRETSSVEKLRHYVQHFRSGIPKTPIPSTPLWGAISWVPSKDQTTCWTMFTGNIVPGLQAPTCTYDTHQRCFTARLMLFAGDIAIDLNSIGDKLATLRQFLLNWIDQNTSFKRTEGKTVIWSLQFREPMEDGSMEGKQRY